MSYKIKTALLTTAKDGILSCLLSEITIKDRETLITPLGIGITIGPQEIMIAPLEVEIIGPQEEILTTTRDRDYDCPPRGGDSYGFSDRPRDRDYSDRPPRDRDRYVYSRGRDDYSRRGWSSPRDEPPVRPRLRLQPRSKPLEDTPTDQPVSTSSIFGGAKPVDTAKREKEIEEKLMKKEQVVVKERKETKKSQSVSIFGDAQPVDTARREREIDEKSRERARLRESQDHLVKPSHPSRIGWRTWWRGAEESEREGGGGTATRRWDQRRS